MDPIRDVRQAVPSRLNRQSPLSGPNGPAETFSSQPPTPPWLQKPEFAAESRPPRPDRSLAGKVGLVAAGLAAGAGATLALMNAAPAPQAQHLTQKQSARALEHFSYLQQVGGTLKADPGTLVERILHHQPKVDAQEAVEALKQGRAVHWQPAPDGPALTVRTPEQLRELKVKVQMHLLRQKFEQGLSNLGDVFQDYAEQLQQELDRALR